jgi:rhodanese-related sulfurtransferase
MLIAGLIVAVVAGFVGWVIWSKRERDRREFERYSISPDGLQALLASGADVIVLDVRQPLDLLAYSEIIPGAIRLAPKEVIENPGLIPRDRDAVVYCTCPSDKTSLGIVRKAVALEFERVKVLKGGLAGWKAKGFPVVPYEHSFRLDTAI